MGRRALMAGLAIGAAVLVWMLRGEVIERPLPPAAPGVDDAEHPVEPLWDEIQRDERNALPEPVNAEATTLQAPALPRIAGIVVRAADGSPIRGVRLIPVLTVPADGSARLTAYETRDGRFEFGPDVVAQGVASLYCIWSEMQSVRSYDVVQSLPTGRQLTQTVVLAEADTPIDELRITFDTGWVVRGRVRDGTGQPVRLVRLQTDRDAYSAWSNDDGTFVLRDLSWRDADVVVSAARRGYTSTSCTVPSPERPACVQSIELTLLREP